MKEPFMKTETPVGTPAKSNEEKLNLAASTALLELFWGERTYENELTPRKLVMEVIANPTDAIHRHGLKLFPHLETHTPERLSADLEMNLSMLDMLFGGDKTLV